MIPAHKGDDDGEMESQNMSRDIADCSSNVSEKATVHG